jgi:phage shock protein PspC (stress-responsive transcriptional regulator)
MNILYLIALVATLVVFVYLVAVLFYPEDFS